MLFTRSRSLHLCFVSFPYSGFLDSWTEEFLDSSGKSCLEFGTSFSTNLILLFEFFFFFDVYIFKDSFSVNH